MVLGKHVPSYKWCHSYGMRCPEHSRISKRHCSRKAHHPQLEHAQEAPAVAQFFRGGVRLQRQCSVRWHRASLPEVVPEPVFCEAAPSMPSVWCVRTRPPELMLSLANNCRSPSERLCGLVESCESNHSRSGNAVNFLTAGIFLTDAAGFGRAPSWVTIWELWNGGVFWASKEIRIELPCLPVADADTQVNTVEHLCPKR